MKVLFSKYQGTGNDFVMLDNLDGKYNQLTVKQIQHLCDRRFGVGADGLIKINAHSTLDFEVDYYNSDGSKSFCGNGARCSISFAEKLGIDVIDCTFLAIDGLHKAHKIDELIYLGMGDVENIQLSESDFILNTGSPHFVRFTDNLTEIDIVELGRKIRYSEPFKKEGINVNVAEVKADKQLNVLTYERGVEDETFSCGTGVTAVALAYAKLKKLEGKHTVQIQVKGGLLAVNFNRVGENSFKNIELIGPGEFVFSGEIDV